MSYGLELPDPLNYKIASWALPHDVHIDFLERLNDRLEKIAPTSITTVGTFEYVSQVDDRSYVFYVRYATRLHNGKYALVDCDAYHVILGEDDDD